MKRFLQHATGPMLLALLALVAVPAQAQDYGSGIVVQVPQAEAEALVMDGQADEDAWADAPVFDMVAGSEELSWSGAWSDHPNPDVQAAAKALWSQDTLYVFAQVVDYQELYFGQPGNAWQGEQILIGVDGTHQMDDWVGDPHDDDEEDTYAGWPEFAPDSLTVYKVTSPEQGGITANWGYSGIFPADSGWVNGTVIVDSTDFVWQVETAIHVPQIEEGAEIGFNIGGATASIEYAEEVSGETHPDSLGDGAYAYFAWSSIGDAGGAVQYNSGNYATLSLVQSVGVEETPGAGVPSAFGLRANYPNPFRQSTTITYDMAQPGHVSLAVYDVLGRQVATLVDDRRAASSYNVRWTPESHVSNGIYFYQLRVDDELIATRRVTLLK